MKLFAYGSNLCGARLRARVPSAEYLGRACLTGYRLRFHKRGADGSGKANAFRTGDAEDRVWGAVFECPEHEKPALDWAEGLGAGYDEAVVTVELDSGKLETVRLYIAAEDAIDDALEPFAWYLDYVLTGAREQGLPPVYVDALGRQSVTRDPDRARAERHAGVLA